MTVHIVASTTFGGSQRWAAGRRSASSDCRSFVTFIPRYLHWRGCRRGCAVVGGAEGSSGSRGARPRPGDVARLPMATGSVDGPGQWSGRRADDPGDGDGRLGLSGADRGRVHRMDGGPHRLEPGARLAGRSGSLGATVAAWRGVGSPPRALRPRSNPAAGWPVGFGRPHGALTLAPTRRQRRSTRRALLRAVRGAPRRGDRRSRADRMINPRRSMAPSASSCRTRTRTSTADHRPRTTPRAHPPGPARTRSRRRGRPTSGR